MNDNDEIRNLAERIKTLPSDTQELVLRFLDVLLIAQQRGVELPPIPRAEVVE